MWVIIIAVIAIIIIVLKSNKKREFNKSVDESELPETLAELRKICGKNNHNFIWFQCSKKICEVGMKLYEEGKLVIDSSSEYDVKTLLGEMIDAATSCGAFISIPRDDAFQYKCLHNASIIATDFSQRNPGKPVLPNNYYHVWPDLADYYTEGKVCKRNPEAARLNWRQHITYTQKTEMDIPDNGIEGIMEIPVAGEDGKEEIKKWIALQYGLGALNVAQGKYAYNRRAQPLQQCAELLFEMDWDRIGSDDVRTMLDEYKKCASKGNAYAQYKLGEFYLKGRYVEKNETMGISYLEQAADQNLYEALNKLADHYYWLAHPFAGDYGNYTKAEIAEFERQYSKWSRRCDNLLPLIADEFEHCFKEYIKNGDKVTPPTFAEGSMHSDFDEDSQEQRDKDAIHSVLSIPDTIMGGLTPHEYHCCGVTSSSKDFCDGIETITIHDSDIGMSGQNATTSAGYFWW